MNKNKFTHYDKLIELVKDGSMVIDVGCSSGYFGKRLIDEKGCIVRGIEIDEIKANEAKMFYKDVYTSSIEDEIFLNSIKEKFDTVIFADVIEHIQNPKPVLMLAGRWLNDDGYILLSVPNVGHWSVIKNLVFGKFEYEELGLLDRNHLRFYTRKSIERLLGECDLDIVLRDSTLGIFVDDIKRSSHWVRFKITLIKLLSRIFPDLFTYQFIYKARPKDA